MTCLSGVGGGVPLTLAPEVVAEINAAVPGDAVSGERYSPEGMATVGL